MTNLRTKLALATLVALAASAALAEPLAVVVDKENPKGDVSTGELRSIYLGKRSDWPDGTRAVPIDLDPSLPARTAFIGAVMGMTPAQFAYHWVDQGVRGAGSPPKTASSPAAAVKLVARVRGAVAFVPVSQVDASVKVVTVDGKKPGEAGYPIAGP